MADHRILFITTQCILMAASVTLSVAAAGCAVPGSQPSWANDSRATDKTIDTDGQNIPPIGSEPRDAYVEGQIAVSGNKDAAGVKIDYVFVRTADFMFFKWRPADTRSKWSFELYSRKEDKTVFGDLGDTLVVIDSRQQPASGLPSGSWISRFSEYLQHLPVDQWEEHLKEVRNGVEIAVNEARATLPVLFANADWQAMHQSTLEKYQQMLDRTINK